VDIRYQGIIKLPSRFNMIFYYKAGFFPLKEPSIGSNPLVVDNAMDKAMFDDGTFGGAQ